MLAISTTHGYTDPRTYGKMTHTWDSSPSGSLRIIIWDGSITIPPSSAHVKEFQLGETMDIVGPTIELDANFVCWAGFAVVYFISGVRIRFTLGGSGSTIFVRGGSGSTFDKGGSGSRVNLNI